VNPFRKAAFGAALVGSTLAGGALGATLLNGSASAQTSTTTPAAATPQAPADAPPDDRGDHDGSMGGHEHNGVTEALLTGDAKSKVEAAAKAAVPGGTIERVENDAEGATYEAHIVKSDGSDVTVKLDANFEVTSTEDGHR